MELRGYRMIAQLGGRTWRARGLADQSLAAVKFLAGADAAALRRKAERQKALGAEAPGVVRVGQVEEIPGGSAVVTPFVEGEALARALERGVRMEVPRAVSLTRSVAESLSRGAAKELAHGALDPARIIVRGDEAFVLGLGMGEACEGPAQVYAAPEVLSGKPSDCRSDIYSLGALLFHMLTGHPPFPVSSLGALKLAKTAELRWPRGSEESIPPRVLKLVQRMMAPEADARHQDYGELLVGFEATTMKRKRRSRRRVALDDDEEPRSWPRAALIAAAMVLVAAALGMRALLPGREAEEKTAEAPSQLAAQPARATAEDEARAAKKELGACAEALEADAGSAELLIPRLERLSRRKDDIGVRAVLLLRKAKRTAEREEAPGPEVVRKPEPAPAEAAHRHEELANLKGRLNAAAAVALELAKLDPARARTVFEEAVVGLELGEHEEEAEQVRAALALAEEARAEEERRKKEEERRERLREKLPRVVARAASLTGIFRYVDALAALRGFLGENPPAEEAACLRGYADPIEREEELFKEIGRRYATGSHQLWMLFPKNGEILRVAGFDREGVTLVSDEWSRQGLSELRMPWMHIEREQAFKLFSEAADMTEAKERLALAVFAFHRGLSVEFENEMTAASLDPGFAEEVEQARAVLGRVDEIRSSR